MSLTEYLLKSLLFNSFTRLVNDMDFFTLIGHQFYTLGNQLKHSKY